ncbi:unnamed protein product [Caenorhabditis angaria]|uniref:Uncharacterized protein n=1 Tax=Caenorhabditis angaria TaxID=860376 RepID=A0A9P1MXP5_9PELO|nr:unnamed protein product [Caenorhabditis angaria]
MFWIILTQEKIDESPKKVFEQHKTVTIESVRNSVKVVQTFANLVKDFSLEDMSPKLFEWIRKELNIVDLRTKILERLPNSIFDNLAHTIKILKQCSLSHPPITEKTEFMAMLNDPIEAQNKEMENIEKPVDKSQDNFKQLSDKESAKTGRLSKQNLVGYSASMTTMLHNYQARTVTRADSFIESYENQVSSRNIADLAQFLLTIILYSIAMIIFGADTAFFIVFQARKITLTTLKKYSNIFMLICLIFAVGLSVYAILGTFRISPFRYDCELIGDSQSSDGKFLNFDGQVANLRSITDECKKDESVYSKMSAHLNKKTISGYLENYQSDVQHFSTGLTSLDIRMNPQAIGSHISNLKGQYTLFKNHQIKNCKNMDGLVLNNIQYIITLLTNRTTDLEEFDRLGLDISTKLGILPSNTNQFIQTSFKELKNITLKTVDTINNQLDSSDISCHLNIPTRPVPENQNPENGKSENFRIF